MIEGRGVLAQQNIWDLKGYELTRQVRRAQAVKNMLKRFRRKLILDIGCAEGFVTSYLAQLSRYVIGIDVDHESLKIAKSKVEAMDFIRASATHLPFRDQIFDVITLLEILEHLLDDALSQSISEVNRVLKDHGALVVSVPYKEKIRYTRCVHCGKLTPLWGHLRSFDENKLSALLPTNYLLKRKIHLPNLGLISCSRLFSWLPFKLWVFINKLFGILRKGYWLIMMYEKS